MLNSNERIIKHKVGLLNLAEELGNVSQACKIMGLSRDIFYRYRDAVNDGGINALLDATTTLTQGVVNIIMKICSEIVMFVQKHLTH